MKTSGHPPLSDTDTSLDIEELVGEMPAQRCEHRYHDIQPRFHADGGEQYVRRTCPTGCFDHVLIYCARIIKDMYRQGQNIMMCPTCGVRVRFIETFTVLGPVAGDKS